MQQSIFQQKLTWVTTDENKVIAFRGYNPQLKIDGKVKDKYEHKDVLYKRPSEIKFEEIERKQIFNHAVHGLIKAKDIVTENKERKSVVFFAFQDGKTNSELKYELLQDNMKELSRNITVELKINLANGETITQDFIVDLNGKLTIGEFIQPLQAVTGQILQVFANGNAQTAKQRALSIMKNESKLLLFSMGEGGKSKPEGPRKFVRFPTHILTEEFYVSTNDQSICFIPNEDVILIGFGFYRHYYDHIDTIQLRTTVRVHDANDSALIQEHPLTHYYVKYPDIEIDQNKIQWYEHLDQGCPPIKVLAGQHMHVTTMYFHPNTGERFFSGRNGSKFAQVDNMDMGLWSVKASRYSTYLTDLEQGLIPGIIYKFA
ncbi:UNKNOWN [Stylonychia lemnae]|uniref:Uncharacterized protein n=1 Tax=Stylonychia lemnae TaxID=5949 RepID=A0A078AXL9_STYLE|nr:UNKNOWN [Stylonychia lemnae]|eukprot:CDW86879.1 UNKNOWN [Stylonychia lemnae]